MTLNEIIVAALSELGRGHDQMNIDSVRRIFTHYANDAIADIAAAIRIIKRERLYAADKHIDTEELDCICLRVLNVYQKGKPVRFCEYAESGIVEVGVNGYVEVEYRCIPCSVSSPSDVPELPEHLHGLIVMYIVGREKMSSDKTTQEGAKLHLQLYEAAKSRFIAANGTSGRLINKL